MTRSPAGRHTADHDLPIVRKTIAENVRHELDVRGWTARRLADETRMSAAQISRLLNKKGSLALASLLRIAYVLGLSLPTLLTPREMVEIVESETVTIQREEVSSS
jgi:transcriptional regulator with XRE-family HTH domain